MQRTWKALVALTAGLALLLLSAAPSSASTGTISGGTLSVNLVPTLTTSLVPGTGPCPGSPSTSLTATSTSAAAGTVTLNIPGSAFTYSGATYFLVGSATGSATLSGTSLSANLSISGAHIYREAAPAGSCVRSATKVCSGASGINIASFPLTGTFTGSFSPPNVTGPLTNLSGSSSAIAASGCTAPFATLNGKTVSISGLNATFV